MTFKHVVHVQRVNQLVLFFCRGVVFGFEITANHALMFLSRFSCTLDSPVHLNRNPCNCFPFHCLRLEFFSGEPVI